MKNTSPLFSGLTKICFIYPQTTPFGPPPPKGGFYSLQTPNVSESVVALSEDSFPAKEKKIDFLAILGA